MATRKSGIPLSTISPKFLHANSTSHTWPFSAIAELIDNSYDPDVRAKQIWIDWTRIRGLDCLSFMDNGEGLTRARLHKMLSFGFSEKKAMKFHIPVGVYGNGFKSGSMRLGKDAIVFTKTRDTMSVGLLSQSYLEAIGAQRVLVPMITFRRDGHNHVEDGGSLRAILSHSLFNSEKELFAELRAISAAGHTGTRIIIWNLRMTSNGETELDFDTDKYDILVSANTSDKSNMTPESEYSLRAYCSILYLKPRMQIIMRGQRVKSQLISKSLALIAQDNYRPSFLNKRVRITFGYNTQSKEHYGIMMYHKNRLIKPYVKVGCQCKAERKGVGVIGVIECNFLQPTHNKQDFDDTDKYRKIMHNLGIKLEEYWNEIRYKRKKEDPKCTVAIEDVLKVPDQVWVQCDSCLKWRRLPDAITELPDKWFCGMNYDPQFRSCLVEEELEDEEEDQKSYPKPFKRQRRNTKSLLEENIPEITQTQDEPALTTIQAPRHPATSVISGPSLAERSPLPLINLTAVSNSLRRVKQKFSAIETQMEVTPSFPVPSLTPPQELFFQTHWPALNEERKTLTQSDTLASKAACGMMEGIESHQGLAAAEETCERDASSGTGREYCSAAARIIELPLKNEKKWVVHHEGHDDDEEEEEEEECNLAEAQQWQDELMELMHETAEERDACRQELEVLQEHSAALEDERNQLICRLESAEEEKSKLSAQCDQLRTQLAELRERSQRGKEEKDDSCKLRTLRLNLSRLLVSFIPSLRLEHVDYSSDVLDTILIQVLEHIT
ncbi:MORC family CW-type zinc finger protein 3b isoform X1 [Carassius gibelio]|uniref:MORC family CW-type zinc finger protein 3b isoform X1 n=1 Tax=Carassius gibelio TaxID=101364 RepID=UPI0022795F04|nr:MORC family CW-type zinc finger protein 3b isoform X1 [Carassius gibelio]